MGKNNEIEIYFFLFPAACLILTTLTHVDMYFHDSAIKLKWPRKSLLYSNKRNKYGIWIRENESWKAYHCPWHNECSTTNKVLSLKLTYIQTALFNLVMKSTNSPFSKIRVLFTRKLKIIPLDAYAACHWRSLNGTVHNFWNKLFMCECFYKRLLWLCCRVKRQI